MYQKRLATLYLSPAWSGGWPPATSGWQSCWRRSHKAQSDSGVGLAAGSRGRTSFAAGSGCVAAGTRGARITGENGSLEGESRLLQVRGGGMLPSEFWEEEHGDENSQETKDVGGAGDGAGGWQRVGEASVGAGECAEDGGGGADRESGEHRGEGATRAVFQEHGGSGRGHAGGEIQFQADAGNEYVRAPDDAHRAVESFILLEDFGGGSARCENLRQRSEGQAGGGGADFVRILHDGARESGRFETGRDRKSTRLNSSHT